jgi:hypothetical protein
MPLIAILKCDSIFLEQAKHDTIDKVCGIVKKQLAVDEDTLVNGETKFADLGADSLDTVIDLQD